MGTQRSDAAETEQHRHACVPSPGGAGPGVGWCDLAGSARGPRTARLAVGAWHKGRSGNTDCYCAIACVQLHRGCILDAHTGV